MTAPLIVIPCGKSKADHATAAADLYRGNFFRACLTYARSLAPDERIVILSGKHGLLTLDTVVAPYEQRIDKPGAITAAAVMAQARDMELATARPVTALTGRAYSRVVARVWPHARYPMNDVPDGMGGRLRWLGKQVTG